MSDETRRLIATERTILGAFDDACERHPDRSALVFLGRCFTYAELRDLALRFATSCRSLEVDAGDRVLLYLPNCPQWLVAYLGLQYAGAVPVPVSPIYTPRELAFLLDNSGARTIVCADTNFGHVREVLTETAVEQIVVTNIADLLPLWKRIAGHLLDRIPTGAVEHGPELHLFHKLLRTQPLAKTLLARPARPRTETAEPETTEPETGIAHILYTGGTTGFPKGVAHTHVELLSGIIGLRRVLESQVTGGADAGAHTLLVALPLFHMFTQDMIFALALHLGQRIVLLPKPKPDAILAHIQQHRATMLIGVPSLYRMLLNNDRLDEYDLGSLAYCWSAGDVLPSETASAWRSRFGLPIHQVYGSTETVAISATRLDEEPRPATLGHLVPTREALIVDPETLDPVVQGTAGELLIGSSYSADTAGYWQNPEETATTYIEVAGRRWCRTGDFVRQIGDGEIEFVDRRADLIKHKGYRISASRVEAVLLDHSAVTAAAVIGIPDPDAGENVKAFVILDESARGVTALELTRHCRDRLLRYEVPDYIEFRDMLPKSKVGKLLRRELKEEEHRRMGR